MGCLLEIHIEMGTALWEKVLGGVSSPGLGSKDPRPRLSSVTSSLFLGEFSPPLCEPQGHNFQKGHKNLCTAI